jgi:hypothetical protein
MGITDRPVGLQGAVPAGAEGRRMGLDFLQHHGGRRLRPYALQPALDAPADGDDAEAEMTVQLDLECPLDGWRPLRVGDQPLSDDALPRRFIDGCHAGETVAWLQDDAGHPIPVRLAEIGGVALRVEGRQLRREFAVVERVVSMIVEPFAWPEVEAFATALSGHGLRLLRATPPLLDKDTRGLTYDFERMREQARVRAQYEMELLEEVALCHEPDTPSLVDGRLGRFQQAALSGFRFIGVIKQQRESYLHARGYQVLYGLEPGERTPAFRLASKHLPVVSWYLKMHGARGALPNWGVVRVEISEDHFERERLDFTYLDRLSRALLDLRCRQGSYVRAPVSLEPIVRAEDSLKALFSSLEMLSQRFYHLTGL